MNTTIVATGSAMPERRIKNSYFLDRKFLNEDGTPMTKPVEEIVAKLEQITGIKERGYISETGDSLPLLTAGAEDAIKNWGKDRNEIDGIIVAHNAGNMLEGRHGFHTVPNLAALLKNRLGITNHECFAYDILFGCPGWVQGVIQANQAIQNGDANNVLVVGLEVASRLLDPYDLDSMILADGCGAAIISKGEKQGIISYATFSHAQDDVSCIYLSKSYNKEWDDRTLFKMNGKDVYKYATTWVPQVIKKALDKAGLDASDVDMFLFHQANGKMLHAFANHLAALYNIEGLNFDGKIPTTIEFTGNTSVATIPTMLDLILKGNLGDYKITPGMKVVFASVGAGMHCNALVYQF
ncbi:Beta-ketoacyl-acyl-carrier-protein synthase III [Leadbetterella byssophila DSM 17132]|uniref:Beta-ketoacyl-acyl-carrier-protein synthase III n=1 Tax=Leadbetterella byssophila (strain DSM 17132 / JCM 16389 / KACC 11308 / NBRC 106382 / 4M15) TaxID=649349 RepID=E4RRB9_LEAB4|nr:3-oxoacyl-ACP synthase III family protein [Leadbetterella byssophila]ADQ18452.1 Beta-ketoacyl-acyl-carrier-protein synthase III [Leadbetterella byssophila DSM 17132]